MEWNNLHRHRLAVIADLVSKVPASQMGRTMLMKMCYFLQELRGMPLGYRFTIYSYGPFDSEVLSDLASAVNLEAVKSKVIPNSVGYGYQLEPSPNAPELISDGKEFLHDHQADLTWVVAEFASKSAADLELESTAVFVDREAFEKKESISLDTLVNRVNGLKPHFTKEYIRSRAQDLVEKQLLRIETLAHHA